MAFQDLILPLGLHLPLVSHGSLGCRHLAFFVCLKSSKLISTSGHLNLLLLQLESQNYLLLVIKVSKYDFVKDLP